MHRLTLRPKTALDDPKRAENMTHPAFSFISSMKNSSGVVCIEQNTKFQLLQQVVVGILCSVTSTLSMESLLPPVLGCHAFVTRFRRDHLLDNCIIKREACTIRRGDVITKEYI